MKKGCLYWLVLGWWLEPILYMIKQTRIVVWIAAAAVLIGFLIMAGAFLVAMAFIFAVLAVLIIIASMIVELIRKIHSRSTCGTDTAQSATHSWNTRKSKKKQMSNVGRSL